MNTPLRLLILEDQPADAELMVLHIERTGFAPRWQRVESEREFTAALGPELDLILADYQLPNYDALRALARVRECGLEAPFIIVSATLGEERAVAAMQQGAADFLIKDRLARLGLAVVHALEQRRLREALRRKEELSHCIAAIADDLTQVVPRYERLSALARALALTPEQVAAVEAADAPLRGYLESQTRQLLNAFRRAASPDSPSAPESGVGAEAPVLLAAVQDTIRVLEQSKRAFKSKALGQLRGRLEALVRSQGEGH